MDNNVYQIITDKIIGRLEEKKFEKAKNLVYKYSREEKNVNLKNLNKKAEKNTLFSQE